MAVSTKVPKRGRRYQQRRRAQRRQPVTPSGRGRTSRASQPDRTVEERNTPVLADLDGDGTRDTVVLSASGAVLFRQGLPGDGGLFAPPD